MTIAMLLLASGRGTRFGGGVPKAYLECRGRSLIEHCVARLAALCDQRDQRELILAVHPEDRESHLAAILPRLMALGLDLVVDGGATRQASMVRALRAASPACDLVLVHDAARPFLPIAASRAAIERARAVGAALLALEAPDTLKRVDGTGRVIETIDRASIWLAQTPQVMQRTLLEAALRRADEQSFAATDDVALLEHAGFTVEVVAGSPLNLKITTRADLMVAEAIADLDSSLDAS